MAFTHVLLNMTLIGIIFCVLSDQPFSVLETFLLLQMSLKLISELKGV